MQIVETNLPFLHAAQIDVDFDDGVGVDFDVDELLDDRKTESAAGGKVGTMLEGEEVGNGRRDAERSRVV